MSPCVRANTRRIVKRAARYYRKEPEQNLDQPTPSIRPGCLYAVCSVCTAPAQIYYRQHEFSHYLRKKESRTERLQGGATPLVDGRPAPEPEPDQSCPFAVGNTHIRGGHEHLPTTGAFSSAVHSKGGDELRCCSKMLAAAREKGCGGQWTIRHPASILPQHMCEPKASCWPVFLFLF